MLGPWCTAVWRRRDATRRACASIIHLYLLLATVAKKRRSIWTFSIERARISSKKNGVKGRTRTKKKVRNHNDCFLPIHCSSHRCCKKSKESTFFTIHCASVISIRLHTLYSLLLRVSCNRSIETKDWKQATTTNQFCFIFPIITRVLACSVVHPAFIS